MHRKKRKCLVRIAGQFIIVICSAVFLISGCAPAKPIGPGTQRDEVLKRYGTPDGCYKITKDSLARGAVEIVTWRGTPPWEDPLSSDGDTIWVFEYKTKHEGNPVCIWVTKGAVEKIVNGPFGKQDR